MASLNNSVDKKNSNLSAFEYLSLIEQASRLHVKKTQHGIQKQEGWLGLMFLAGHSVLMCPLVEITAIVPLTQYVPLPKVKPWLIGITSYQGEALSITDIAGMLTNEKFHITKHSRILVISLQDEYIGILVKRVLGLQRVKETYAIDLLPKGLMGEYYPFVTGGMMTEKFKLPIVSCQAIVRHPMFMNVIDQKKEQDNGI